MFVGGDQRVGADGQQRLPFTHPARLAPIESLLQVEDDGPAADE